VTYIYSSTTRAAIQRSAIIQARRLRGCSQRSRLRSFPFELQRTMARYSRGWARSSSNHRQNSEQRSAAQNQKPCQYPATA